MDYNESYTAMVRRHEKIIFSVCFFYASGDIPFDDLRQEVLLSLFKGYSRFRGDCAESTWVYKVSINACLLSLRRLVPKVRTMPIHEMPPVQWRDEGNAERKEKLEWLHAAIGSLHPMDKALILMWLDELSYEDIAANMGIPRNTVATRLHRIKEKLMKRKEM